MSSRSSATGASTSRSSSSRLRVEPVREAAQRPAPRARELLRDVDHLQDVRRRLVATGHRQRRLDEARALDGQTHEVAQRERALRAMQVGHHLERLAHARGPVLADPAIVEALVGDAPQQQVVVGAAEGQRAKRSDDRDRIRGIVDRLEQRDEVPHLLARVEAAAALQPIGHAVALERRLEQLDPRARREAGSPRRATAPAGRRHQPGGREPATAPPPQRARSCARAARTPPRASPRSTCPSWPTRPANARRRSPSGRARRRWWCRARMRWVFAGWIPGCSTNTRSNSSFTQPRTDSVERKFCSSRSRRPASGPRLTAS